MKDQDENDLLKKFDRLTTIRELRRQSTIGVACESAEDFFEKGKLEFYEEGAYLINDGDYGNSIIFILSGKVAIKINNREVAERVAGQHVGEMALIDASQPRSADVIAKDATVGFVVSEKEFSEIASKYPDLWREIAAEIAQRLRQRNKHVRPQNHIPEIFIASAKESKDVAESFKGKLDGEDIKVTCWTDENLFKPSITTVHTLEDQLKNVDFVLAVLSKDDIVKSRKQKESAPRDNTIYELGLFTGAVGVKRAFFAKEEGSSLKIPSDLVGLTYLSFSQSKVSINIEDAVKAIKSRIAELGPI